MRWWFKKYQDRTAVETEIKKVIAQKLGSALEEVTPIADFVDDLGADSLDRTEIRLMLEDKFGIKIFDEEMRQMNNLQQATDCVAKHLGL
jgi:acyl carrier protein